MEFNASDMILSVINFLVLVFILNRVLYKPFLGIMEKRKEEIANSLENAKEAEAKAAALRAESEENLRQSRQEAQDILERAAKLGEETKTAIIAQAKAEAGRITEKAQDMIRQEKEEALSAIRAEVASLVVMAAGKIIGRTLQEEDHKKLIEDMINEVGDVS